MSETPKTGFSRRGPYGMCRQWANLCKMSSILSFPEETTDYVLFLFFSFGNDIEDLT